VGVPAKVVRVAGEKTNYASDIDQISVSDPVAQELIALREQVEHLTQYLTKER
jgi:serine O-acetyltransferase